MAYGLKYQIRFLNIDNEDVWVKILGNGYTGAVTTLQAAGASPVVIDYKSGDFYANDPIRASTATIKYYNDGTLPLTTFASNDDKAWQVQIWVLNGAYPYWSGFISQDDCIEDLVPAPNEVTLNCNDGLGLLKQSYFTDDQGNILYSRISLINCFYYILLQTGLNLSVLTSCNLFEAGMSDRSVNVKNTPFEQLWIDARSFLLSNQSVQDYASGPNAQIVQLKDKVMDSYTVLSRILDAWGCTIVQSKGSWVIIRWHELKYFNNVIPSTFYIDSTFTSSSYNTTDSSIQIGSNGITPINVSQSRQIVRPNKYARLTFNYEQPQELILNSNLKDLGALISSTVTGTGVNLITTNDYGFNDWSPDPRNTAATPALNALIRVIYNYLGVENDRYAVIKQGILGQRFISTAFDVNLNDRANLSLSFRTNSSQTGSRTNVFTIRIYPPGTTDFGLGTSNYWQLINDAGGLNTRWQFNSGGWGYYTNDDLINWHDVSIDMPAFPMDGIMVVYIHQANDTLDSTFWKNINLTLYSYISNSLQVTGHYNESNQPVNIKKNLDKVVYLDDSPKNSVKGCMFLTDKSTKTAAWHRGTISEKQRFGFIQSADWMYFTNKFRAKIDGTYRGLRPSTAIGYYIGAASVMNFDFIPNTFFIFGQCSFDLKNGEFSGTLQEIYNSTDYPPGYSFPGTEFTNIFSYLFNYH